jgi:hypothetical protein
MKAKLILTLSFLALSGLPYAADNTAPAKPQSGAATTKQQGPSHPATDSATATQDKAGAGTTAEQSPKHPAARGDTASGAADPQATTGGGGVRDWAAIDTNRDSAVSPEEMQKFLDDVWANKKSSG